MTKNFRFFFLSNQLKFLISIEYCIRTRDLNPGFPVYKIYVKTIYFCDTFYRKYYQLQSLLFWISEIFENLRCLWPLKFSSFMDTINSIILRKSVSNWYIKTRGRNFWSDSLMKKIKSRVIEIGRVFGKIEKRKTLITS